MTLEKIPLEAPKSEGAQPRYKGIALTKAEQAACEKVNEVVEYINSVAESFGMGAELFGKCCEDEEEKKDFPENGN